MALLSVRRHVQYDREHIHHLHAQRLAVIQPVIDARVPHTHAYVRGRVDTKAIIAKYVRGEIIAEENERLSKSLAEIYTRPVVEQTQHFFDPELDRMRRHTQACFDHRRLELAKKTEKENRHMGARLNGTGSSVGARAYQQFYDKNLKAWRQLRTRFKPKKKYSDFLEQRDRQMEQLLAQREQHERQRRELERQWFVEYHRELLEQLDPAQQAKWMEKVLQGPPPSDFSSSPTRSHSASPSRPSTANPLGRSRSRPSTASAGGASSSVSPMKMRRSKSAGPMRPPPQWDSSPVGVTHPATSASNTAASTSTSSTKKKRSSSASVSPTRIEIRRPPSRTPNKTWTNEDYIKSMVGLNYKPSSEELKERKKDASKEAQQRLQETKELTMKSSSSSTKLRPSSASVTSTQPSTDVISSSPSSSTLFFASDHLQLSPDARARLTSEATAIQSELELAQAQERERAARRQQRRLAKEHSTNAVTKSSKKKKKSVIRPSSSSSAILGRPSRALHAILSAQKHAEAVMEEEKQQQDESVQEEIARARRQVIQRAKGEQANSITVPTISSSLEFEDPQEASQYGGSIKQQHQSLPTSPELKSSPPSTTAAAAITPAFTHSLLDDDEEDDLPEMAPPSRPWASPIPLPPLSMAAAQARELAHQAKDVDAVPHAQGEGKSGKDGKSPASQAEEEKWRGKLDWEEALAEVPTPHVHIPTIMAASEEKEQSPSPHHQQHQHHRHDSQASTDDYAHEVQAYYDQQRLKSSDLHPHPAHGRAISKPLRRRPGTSPNRRPTATTTSTGASSGATGNLKRLRPGSAAVRFSSPGGSDDDVLDEGALLSTNVSVSDLKQLLGTKDRVRPSTASAKVPSSASSAQHTKTLSHSQSRPGSAMYYPANGGVLTGATTSSSTNTLDLTAANSSSRPTTAGSTSVAALSPTHLRTPSSSTASTRPGTASVTKIRPSSGQLGGGHHHHHHSSSLLLPTTPHTATTPSASAAARFLQSTTSLMSLSMIGAGGGSSPQAPRANELRPIRGSPPIKQPPSMTASPATSGLTRTPSVKSIDTYTRLMREQDQLLASQNKKKGRPEWQA